MKVENLTADHVRRINLQPAQRLANYTIDANMLAAMTTDGFAGVIGDEVIFCVGRVRFWEGRYELWGLLSVNACKHMVWVTRVAKRLLALCEGSRRLEIIVSSEFKAAHRWAKMLGFSLHHHEEQFMPDGSDADIYVRFC